MLNDVQSLVVKSRDGVTITISQHQPPNVTDAHLPQVQHQHHSYIGISSQQRELPVPAPTAPMDSCASHPPNSKLLSDDVIAGVKLRRGNTGRFFVAEVNRSSELSLGQLTFDRPSPLASSGQVLRAKVLLTDRNRKIQEASRYSTSKRVQVVAQDQNTI